MGKTYFTRQNIRHGNSIHSKFHIFLITTTVTKYGTFRLISTDIEYNYLLFYTLTWRSSRKKL